jgi:hypothetical protein
MAYKRNRSAPSGCAGWRAASDRRSGGPLNAATQWLERGLDDSAAGW